MKVMMSAIRKSRKEIEKGNMEVFAGMDVSKRNKTFYN